MFLVPGEKAFENILGKGGICCLPTVSLPNMYFSCVSQTPSSLYQTSPGFYVSEVKVF